MCGICGTVGRAEERELRWMTDVMAHRGPDGEGLRLFPAGPGGEPACGLGHRRLAIIDPTPTGAQPMSWERWHITYNGEIYNYRELKAELEGAGHAFHSGSDTEVLLRLFALHGPAMLDRLNGIYALAIWNDVDHRLFVARDRLGVKPLYYLGAGLGGGSDGGSPPGGSHDGGSDGGSPPGGSPDGGSDGGSPPGGSPGPAPHGDAPIFAFASELKCLLPYIGRPTLEPSALADYLTFLWVPDPKTAFAGIHKLPPGHYAWVDAGGVAVTQWWDLRFAPEERSEAEWVAAVRAGVHDAVLRQTVADVPLGSFLSGGIDSTAVVAALASGGETVATYTIGFSERDLAHEIVPDDLKYAREMGRHYATDYHETILEPDVLELLPFTVWHLEEPLADPAAISTYLICREARKGMPVMLSGVGGDEVFSGYPRHLAYRISRYLDLLPGPVRRCLDRAATPVARPGSPGRLRGPRRNLWKFMRAAGMDKFDRYLSFCTYYTADELAEVLAPGAVPAGYDPLARHRAYITADSGGDEHAQLLYVDAKTFLPCLNLTYTDKMGMAASVEVRVPLLDDDLVALAARIPSQLKLKGTKRKYVFKKSQEGLVPHDVIWRPKAGFGAPVRSWLERDLAPLVADLLSQETIERRGLVRHDAVQRMWEENSRGEADYSLRLYAILALELWCRTFLDREWTFDQPAHGPLAL